MSGNGWGGGGVREFMLKGNQERSVYGDVTCRAGGGSVQVKKINVVTTTDGPRIET